MEKKEELEVVIQNLSDILKVDRGSLARALGQLLAGPKLSKEESLASRAGLQIVNHGPGSVVVLDSNLADAKIAANADRWFMPQQFAMKPTVSNAPYQALGMLASSFLHLSIELERGDEATLAIDWTKMFNNSGLWGNPRLVVRHTGPGGVRSENARELAWKVDLGDEVRKVEFFAIGMGLDAKAMSPQVTSRSMADLRAGK